jgi:hypothetical protein
MTTEQLIANLRLFPRQSVVVVETARTFVAVYAASPSRVHLTGHDVEPHHGAECAACSRHAPLAPAVSLLSSEKGGAA